MDARHPYPAVTPHLTVTDVGAALDFYARAFGARELVRLTGPGGAARHGEMLVGDGLVTLGPAGGDLAAPDPAEPGQASLTWFSDDADAAVARAVDTGARLVAPVAAQFHDRHLGVGPKWVIQRRRLHDTLGEIDQGRAVDWAALALRLGFADQAHFVRAFTDTVGRPPSAYERS